MRISVLTVVRDGMPHVNDALRSLAAQGHDDVQHVVVDACSSDGTTEAVARSRPDVHVVEPDHGLYDALNKAVARADGDAVGLLHSDDVYESPHVLESVATRFEERDRPDLVLTDIVYVDDDDRVVRRYRSNRFHPQRLRWGWMPAHTGMYARRSVYEDVGAFRTDYEIGADFEWVARAFSTRDLTFAYLPIVSMRMRMGGASTRGIGATVTLNREVVRACRENNIATTYFHVLSKYPMKLLDKYARR